MTLPRFLMVAVFALAPACIDDGTSEPFPDEDENPGPVAADAAAAPLTCAQIFGGNGPTSAFARYDASGKLGYKKLERGDQILDFSSAGYMGGGVKIPDAPVKQTLSPSGGDDTAAIQAAINSVAALPVGANGLRGAVLLRAGKYKLSGTLKIGKSGVVLRGSGNGTSSSSTIVNLTGAPHRFLEIAGSGSLSTSGAGATMTDPYVPAGARSFKVNDASGFAVGDTVVVERPVTAAWVHFMDMDTLVRNGQPQTWLKPGTKSRADRVIAAISGNTITLDVPLPDSFDKQHTTGKILKYKFAGRISQVGAEHIRVVAPHIDAPISQPQYGFVSLNAVIDGWVRDMTGVDTENGMSVGGGTKRITVEDVDIVQTGPSNTNAGSPAQFAFSGTQILIARCSSVTNKSFSIVTQAQVSGPNVVLDFVGSGTGPHIQPHQRWATGLLVDGATLTGGNIELMNRGTAGSGHGWTMGWGVAWNSQSGSLTIQKPPGTTNFAIGNIGTLKTKPRPGGPSTPLPQGTVDKHGAPVLPSSLYLAQLCERLGPQALTNIGYPP